MLSAKDFVPCLAHDEADADGTPAQPPHPAPLVPGSATAQALLAAWRGDPVVIVDSPPGGGKTEAAVTIAAHLASRAGLVVYAAFPKRMQALAFTHRLVRQLPPSQVVLQMAHVAKADLLQGVRETQPPKGGYVVVKTVASLAAASRGHWPNSGTGSAAGRVLLVDEGYQVTLSDLTSAAEGFGQVVILGDPGQIGPVVTHDISLWSRSASGPHVPAPSVLRRREAVSAYHIDGTWRLGPETVNVLAPCYDFSFQSRRPPRSAAVDGTALGEIERLVLPADDERQGLKLVAERAAALVGAELRSSNETMAATERDVVVVVSRNAQVAVVSAHLADLGASGVQVATADRMQGGEWPLVVSLDPCYGASPGDDHATSAGRTCVMMSRHTTHLTWAHDDRWYEVLGRKEADVSVKVRHRVMGAPLAPLALSVAS
jgi:hypothetical protein